MASIFKEMVSRRLILGTLAAVGYFSTLGESSTLAAIFFRPKRKEKPQVRENPFMAEGKALVGVAGVGTPMEMVREAVNLIGGLGRLQVKGKTVLVKPNVVSSKPNPSTTNPAVVEAVVRLLYEAGAREVVVGDMSAMMTRFTLRNMKKNGIRHAAERAGAKVVAFEDYGWIEVDISAASYVKKAYVTEWLYRADLVVNLPVVKTHRSASYSICLKNFIGCTHLKQRPYLIDSSHWEELVAEFNLACRPDLNIVDATVSMIEGGPWEGTPANTGMIIASGDRVAADIVGLGLIRSFGKWDMVTGKGVWEQRQIRHALKLGLGKSKENIRLVTGKMDGRLRELVEKIKAQTGL